MSIAGNWLVLDYPKMELQKASLRKHSRIPINLECSIIERSSQARISHGLLSDISINGCAYIGEPLIECTVDSKYDLHIKEEAEESALSSPVTVKNILEKEHHTNQQKYGLAFEDSSPKTQDFIQKVILRHLSLSASTNIAINPE
jgi:c-di-GMP-binding flagellar brake protein YcgR